MARTRGFSAHFNSVRSQTVLLSILTDSLARATPGQPGDSTIARPPSSEVGHNIVKQMLRGWDLAAVPSGVQIETNRSVMMPRMPVGARARPRERNCASSRERAGSARGGGHVLHAQVPPRGPAANTSTY